MLVEIIKHTDISTAHEAIEFTTGHRFEPRASLESIYGWNHSISRTQMFSVKMYDIPTFVSVHFVRHKIWVEHFVKSNRPDRDGDDNANRHTPVNHMMFCNAEALVNMSHRRLCCKSSMETVKLMSIIKVAMLDIDYALAQHLVPMCQFRGGICSEPVPCGSYKIKRFGVES